MQGVGLQRKKKFGFLQLFAHAPCDLKAAVKLQWLDHVDSVEVIVQIVANLLARPVYFF